MPSFALDGSLRETNGLSGSITKPLVLEFLEALLANSFSFEPFPLAIQLSALLYTLAVQVSCGIAVDVPVSICFKASFCLSQSRTSDDAFPE